MPLQSHQPYQQGYVQNGPMVQNIQGRPQSAAFYQPTVLTQELWWPTIGTEAAQAVAAAAIKAQAVLLNGKEEDKWKRWWGNKDLRTHQPNNTINNLDSCRTLEIIFTT